VDVLLPKWGMSMQEGTITEWLVAEGDAVTEGQVIANVEADKVEAEIEAPGSGTLARIDVEEGETVDVGTVLARIEQP
jgi:pyruvate/2-oxoglutarate dehydrogenase complex dihydrolipoamide acyltransferase (E2) component